jgi:hypothetical protein
MKPMTLRAKTAATTKPARRGLRRWAPEAGFREEDAVPGVEL